MKYEYETKVMHPTLENRLMANKIAYAREVPMPLWGRADFIIYFPSVTYIAECKRNCSEIRKAIAQVLCYQMQYNSEYAAMIIVPKKTVTSEALMLCAKWGIKLARMEFPASDEYLLEKLMSVPNGIHKEIIG